MTKHSILMIASAFILASCSPKVRTSLTTNYSALDYREEVRVFDVNQPEPVNSEEIGTVKIGDSGFTTNCGWDVVLEKAKNEARKAGGNAIKITVHKLPDVWTSTCHRITAKILKVSDFDAVVCKETIDSTLINADYALLHVYRDGGYGGLLSYDLHLGDSVIYRVSNSSKKTIRIKKDGLNSLWAKTEAKAEIPVNIKFGNEYYVRCSVTMGVLVGRPKLELVDNEIGKSEFKYIDFNANDNMDVIFLKDGRELECVIDSEDDQNVYFTLDRNGRKVSTQINKKDIEEIQRAQ